MADNKIVGVPTLGGVKDAFKDWGIGLIAGLGFLLIARIFPLGLLAAPLLVGSMVKGERGKILAVLAGFMLVTGILGTATNANASSSDAGVM